MSEEQPQQRPENRDSITGFIEKLELEISEAKLFLETPFDANSAETVTLSVLRHSRVLHTAMTGAKSILDVLPHTGEESHRARQRLIEAMNDAEEVVKHLRFFLQEVRGVTERRAEGKLAQGPQPFIAAFSTSRVARILVVVAVAATSLGLLFTRFSFAYPSMGIDYRWLLTSAFLLVQGGAAQYLLWRRRDGKTSSVTPHVPTTSQQEFFGTLVENTLENANRYYEQTEVQARRSFMVSCAALVVAFGVILLGVVRLFYDHMSAAVLTTAAGVVAELIASLFFYFYNQTVQKMSQYHRKLIVTQNIALALRLSEDLEQPHKDETRKALVASLTERLNEYLYSGDLAPSAKASGARKSPLNGGPARRKKAAAVGAEVSPGGGEEARGSAGVKESATA